ncbi:hypothetical protein [Rhizobium laguerreae]|uniref:hypothetical protein n=1 Tax=Rhizobium laguerreae TaxID=1076926 RepID=UPI001C927471|nr:hypothetical protein [Rhizobium laguerreae]MBY3364969.1 hypothetical protein [Rhizobium laguerreae]MBY3384173.1 hypothetical protein [Rhizobium laguerreae]MBY3397834.1 hypothetical protein [Rhizobium laguerreae]MBY3404774.1 hypothetical protein [Rhizobium laguerreae]
MNFSDMIKNLRQGVDDEVITFFIAVSRFDFAFKQAGGFFTRPIGSNPDIDWQDSVPSAFVGFEAQCVDLHSSEFFVRPPRTFKRVGGVTKFVEQPPALTDTKSIFWAIWTLRKNLMHGTKGKLFSRDQILVRDANVVLERVFKFSQQSADPRLKRVAEIMVKFESYGEEDSGA